MTHSSEQSDDPDQRRLDDLGKRIDAVRGQTPETKPAPTSLSAIWRLSTELVAAVFVGAALGIGFDRLTGLRPLGIILFLILGVAAGFTMVFRTARLMDAQAKDQKKED
ncbi:MAG: AtpZ/AtpI family protein [Alphaproteobacteria bacterium]|nr:AtpZ/AtpI family protein [Alphaproteobacteria bacterium]